MCTIINSRVGQLLLSEKAMDFASYRPGAVREPGSVYRCRFEPVIAE